MESKKQGLEDDFNLKEIFKVLKKYKWIIFITTIISIFVASTIVYFNKPLYSAYSIVKVKQENETISKNLILNPKLEMVTNINEDMALLKTFYMNNKAINLNRVKFQVQYYINNGYKSIEIYKKIPIKIMDIDIIDKSFIGAKLRITPKKDGYSMEFVHSFKKRLMSKLFKKPLLKIEVKQPFKYQEKITTKFFTLKVDKLSNFNRPIDIIINGDNRYIYNNIISNNLKIIQMNEKVPHIKIYYQDRVPSRAISYVKSLTQSFINDSLSENSKQSNQISDFIKNELGKIKKQLKESEKKLEKYRISNRAVQPSLQATTFIKELSSVNIALSENQLRVHIINNLVKFIKKNHDFDSIAPSLMELEDKTTLKLIELLHDAQLIRDELLIDFTPKHPKVKKVDRKINIIKNKIILNIKNLQKHIMQEDKNLKKVKKSYEKKIEILPTKERKIINIKRDYEVSSKMYNLLLEKQTENEILKVVNMSKYKIIDKPYSDFSPIGNKGKAILASSIFIGLFLGILLIVIYRIYSDKILTAKDIETRTDIPIYGVVPFLTTNNSEFTEQYNNLRTNLQLSDNKFKVILLSSTVDNEGKEMVTIDLGSSFAMVDYKTVIIDLDMRNSVVNRISNIETNKGISDYIAGVSTIEEIIYETKDKNLNIIPTGKNYSNISKLLLSKKLPILIERLKIDYDYIVINTTPFGLLTDTKHIMKLSDINLVLFREGYSYKTSIINLNQIKEQNSINNLGIIFLENS